MGVGGDRGDLRVGHGNLGIEGGELEVLLVLLGAVVAAREREDQRIVALELAEPARRSRVIGQLVVREHAAGCDVGAHQSTSAGSCQTTVAPQAADRARGLPGVFPGPQRAWRCRQALLALHPRPRSETRGRSRAFTGATGQPRRAGLVPFAESQPVKSSERSSFMTSASTQVLSFKRKALAAVAALTMAGVVSAVAAGPASAATEVCGPFCISVFSSELGTMDQPNFVEAVLGGGGANVGQPVGLKRASNTDPSEDILPGGATGGGQVSDFYADGLVSADANSHYGNLDAVQQKYAPFGIETGLCVGLAKTAYQNEGLTLQPCDDPTTVWVVYPAPEATTGPYFPIVNATTTDFNRPFAMHLPRNEVASGRPLQMQVRRLQYRTGEKTLPARQLWGAVFGELK